MGDAIQPIEDFREHHERGELIGLWVRRFGLVVLTAVIVVALLNVVGQRATTVDSEAVAAGLSLHAPAAVRPGLLFQARIAVTAHRAIPAAQLVLGHGWIDGLTLNTAEPGPINETSGPDGSLVFSLGRLSPGQTFVQYLDYQVNPTSLSRRTQSMVLRSGGVDLATLHRTLTIVP
jgi:hypothetical protein